MYWRRMFGDSASISVANALVIIMVAGPIAGAEDSDRKESISAPSADATVGPELWYQLVNVTIPADSNLRKDTWLNHPPTLYVIVKRNGVRIGEDSTQQVGWSVDFKQSDDRDVNVWSIRQGPHDRYTVEVWDDQWGLWGQWSNQMVFNVTGLTAKDFDAMIIERGGKLMEPHRLATIKFELVNIPKEEDEGARDP